ncbi:MAG: cellulase family glycosylhydrolase [Prosthecobacter sp.]|uniref:cellulase family glycosylhydrolase n=1 Tax=Prosthecobacter sp. TaxID=1965333 RepID=UPI0039025066
MASTTRIGIQDGRFVEKNSGKPFRPFGVNYYRTAPIDGKKRGHCSFSPGSYDEAFITQMMQKVSHDGFNTVRSFLSNHSGLNGIVTDPQSGEINPAYLANLIHFLRAAEKHHLHVILTWDTWSPDSRAWAEKPLTDEARHGFSSDTKSHFSVNGYRLNPKPIRAKAIAICTLIEALRKSTPELLAVVLAWELENEVHFKLDQEPFVSRSAAFAFGGRSFDLRSDDGAQALMDTATSVWATACADAIHAADAEALVSASVFTFAAVGRQGPGTWSKDDTKDMRIPARPLALLDSSLDFVDLHLYAGRSNSRNITQHLQHDLTSVELPSLIAAAKRLGKPILIGESGIGAHVTRRGPDWQTIRHDASVALLREFHQALAPQPFAGLLHWHYGSPDSAAQNDYPALTLFPQYGEVLKAFHFSH